jgi:hypothetical protein
VQTEAKIKIRIQLLAESVKNATENLLQTNVYRDKNTPAKIHKMK